MKKLLFTLALMLSSTTFAATGTGEAQAELTNPLTVTNTRNTNFGTIAIDPGAGAQIVTLNHVSDSIFSCPETYVCAGAPLRGMVTITGAPSTPVSISVDGQTAILSDGAGHFLTFDPRLYNGDTSVAGIVLPVMVPIGGTIAFTGNEVSGSYSSQNAGGSGYVMTVNY